MNLVYQYQHKHNDDYSIELFKKFKNNIEITINNIYNDFIKFKLEPYIILNYVNNGSNNYTFKLDENYIMRLTNPLSICKWDEQTCIDKNKLLIEYELFGMNIQKKLSIYNNIAKIYSYGIIEIRYNNISSIIAYSIMDYFKNNVLNPAEDTYSKKDVKIIMKIILNILILFDNEGYCHRDIQPQNIMFIKKDDVKTLQLIDFGGGSNLNNKGLNKLDIWSLGILCCSLLLGKNIDNLPNYSSYDTKYKNIEKNNIISIFNIQNNIFDNIFSIEDITVYYNEINNIYFDVVNKYPEFTDLLNELLGVQKNECINNKDKYEKILLLEIFKN